MRKKLIIMALAICLVLTACNRKPTITAESLIDNAGSIKENGSTVSATIVYELAVVMDMSEDGATPVPLRTAMNGQINIKGNDEVCYMNSKVSAGMLGITDTRTAEQWTQFSGDIATSYYRDTADGLWTVKKENVVVGENPTTATLTDIFTLKSGDFTELKLQKAGEGYAVTGKIDGKLLDEKLGGISDISGGFGGTDGPVNATMLFDKDKRCQSVVFDFAPSHQSEDGTEVESFKFGIYIDSYSNEKMEIPAEVLSNLNGQQEEQE